MKKVMLLLFFFLIAVTARSQEADWDFSREDYQTLIDSGGELTFHSDSDWYPEVLKKNLLVVLNYVLNPNLEPASTYGINTDDFFHGHIECLNVEADAYEMSEKYWGLFEGSFLKEFSVPWWDVEIPDLDPTQFYQYTLFLEKALSVFLKQTVIPNCPSLVGSYHTFEWSRPEGMDINSPRRILSVKVGQQKVEHVRERQKFEDEHTTVIHFAFLIDTQGQIHVVHGTDKDLYKVTNFQFLK